MLQLLQRQTRSSVRLVKQRNTERQERAHECIIYRAIHNREACAETGGVRIAVVASQLVDRNSAIGILDMTASQQNSNRDCC